MSGIDELVISLSAKGLTHGEISAHLAEVYGAAVYPVVFLDAIVRHEAPHVRGEVRDLRRWVVAAACLKLGAA